MTFNTGFLCPSCGPIEKATSKTIKKVQHRVCPDCSTTVNAWVRPLNERPGRCSVCAHGQFKQRMNLATHELIRICKNCGEGRAI